MPTMPPLVLRMRPFLVVAIAVIAVVLGCLVTAPRPARSQVPASPASGFTFALIGDLGYVPEEEPGVDHVLADLNRDTTLAFVVHVGDLSSPRFGCTDALWAKRLAQFRASAHPLVYTPGDNEWTDCHEPTVPGGNPLERLAKLRTVFFAGEHTLGQRSFALTRQSQSADPTFTKYWENVRWDLGGVTFLTLHVTGSNNGLGRTPEGDAEYGERNQANLAWLRQGFEHAKATNSRAIVIMQQANMFPEFAPFPGTPQTPSGYADLRGELQKETTAFGKPVVLVHGDSHFFRVDKPLSPRPARGVAVTPALENFTRVETFGTPYHHWVHVTVDPNDPNVFTFRPRLVAANLTPQP
jgi:hypothetical protein